MTGPRHNSKQAAAPLTASFRLHCTEMSEDNETQSLLNQERGKTLSETDLADRVLPAEVSYEKGKTLRETDVADRVLPVEVSYENVTMDNVDNDGHNNPTGINGIPWEQMHVKNLRTICSRLSVRGVKNAKKAFIIDAISRWCRNRWVYDSQMVAYESRAQASGEAGVSPSTRKEVQCTFRLMNILFSDEFAGDFATLGDVASRESLDSGKGGNNQLFWERVQDAFAEPDNNDYNCLYFTDDKDGVFAAQGHINPAQIIEHDWKKLRLMWKSVNADYKSALTRFTVSGTHNSDFFGFCGGKLESYYLRKHLERRPELNSMVAAELPHECFLASEMSAAEVHEKIDSAPSSSSNIDDSNSSSGNPSVRKKQRTRASPSQDQVASDAEKVVDAIREFTNAKMQAEIAKQKLHYMEKEDSRRGHELLLYEWDKIQNSICMLRDQLDRKNIDNRTKKDLEKDIDRLLSRKEELAEELGLNNNSN
jgi:hypothetical protein